MSAVASIACRVPIDYANGWAAAPASALGERERTAADRTQHPRGDDGTGGTPRHFSNWSDLMSADEEVLKRRYREFLDLMPLTVAIAGLPPSEGHYNYNTDQMEVRSRTLVAAYKLARQLAKESIRE